jgi:hypothetical protein
MDKTHEAVVNRHLAAENAHRMQETLAELHPDCVFEDLPLGKDLSRAHRSRSLLSALVGCVRPRGKRLANATTTILPLRSDRSASCPLLPDGAGNGFRRNRGGRPARRTTLDGLKVETGLQDLTVEDTTVCDCRSHYRDRNARLLRRSAGRGAAGACQKHRPYEVAPDPGV